MKRRDYEQVSLFTDAPASRRPQQERRKGKPTQEQNPPQEKPIQENTTGAERPPVAPPIQSAGPYPPPQRACYVCGKIAWKWNGEQYICASGDQAHPEYEAFVQQLHRRIFGQP